MARSRVQLKRVCGSKPMDVVQAVHMDSQALSHPMPSCWLMRNPPGVGDDGPHMRLRAHTARQVSPTVAGAAHNAGPDHCTARRGGVPGRRLRRGSCPAAPRAWPSSAARGSSARTRTHGVQGPTRLAPAGIARAAGTPSSRPARIHTLFTRSTRGRCSLQQRRAPMVQAQRISHGATPCLRRGLGFRAGH